MKEVKPPKKPLVFYYFIVMLVMMLLNSLLIPRLFKPQVEIGRASSRERV